jgi:hypothetical protein
MTHFPNFQTLVEQYLPQYVVLYINMLARVKNLEENDRKRKEC